MFLHIFADEKKISAHEKVYTYICIDDSDAIKSNGKSTDIGSRGEYYRQPQDPTTDIGGSLFG